ncbi:MAG: SDR family oxidoreductase [Thermodesulfobacteriota bacterium]
MRNFIDKKVVITGAASGIGRALADRFARAGAKVIMMDINGPLLKKASDEIAEAHGREVFSLTADVTDFDAFGTAVRKVIDELGFIDVFINNAGLGISGEFVRNTRAEIDRITAVNYLGMVYGSRIILEHFYRQGYGHLVNVASVAGLQGFPRMSLYCGTKCGIVGFTQAVRFEAERAGIHVSLALPSTTATPLILEKMDLPDDEIPGVLLAIPVCRVETVAEAIFNGISRRCFMIFPTLTDRGTLFMRSFMPGVFNLFIRLVGFRSFRRKRERLMRQQG